jgi:glycosyltransferase involved in cell wall biosynthesis
VLAVRRDGFDIEVIVADDASTDETPQIASVYPLKYARSSAPGGASAARNLGLSKVSGDFVAFLDDDDEWLPDNIAPQLKLLAEHPELGAVHGQAILVDTDDIPFLTTELGSGQACGWVFEDVLTYWPQIGTLVVRADVARAVGPFDPTLVGDQDWDWMLRLARRYPFGRIPEAVLLFYQRAHGDVALQWRRFPFVIRVFLKNTRDLPFSKQLRLRKILWRHRGWYASQFLLHGQQHLREGDKRGAWRCLGYAVRASLPHTASLLAKQSLSGVAGRRQAVEVSDSGVPSGTVAAAATGLASAYEEALDH